MHRTIAILSPGDMGHAIGQSLTRRGHRVLAALEGRSRETRDRAERAGFEDAGTLDAVVDAADWILSILPPAAAEPLARDVAAAMVRCERHPAYADCNAIAPSTAKRIETLIGGANGSFVDAGIIGGPPGRSPLATRIYASGSGASGLAFLGEEAENEIELRVVGSDVGHASGLKMAYAGLTKGTMTLHTAVLVAAQRLGLFEDLARELSESQPQAWARMGVIPFLPADAGRWIGEMQEIATTFREAGVSDEFHRGAKEIFELMTETPFASETRETLDRSRTLREAVEAFARVNHSG